MGKKDQKKGGGGKSDHRARDKVDHRGGGRRGEDCEDQVPQELIERAAKLGCEVWELEKYEAKAQMEEADSDEEEDSDLSEESKQAVKPKKAKANMAAANRDMPPNSSDEDDDDATEVIPEEEEKKEEEKVEEQEDDSDDDELERLYGMGKNNNKSVKVVA